MDRLELGLLAVANPVAFALRRAVRFRRAGYRESPRRAAPAALETWLRSSRATELLRHAGLKQLAPHLSRTSLAETLLFAEALEQLHPHFGAARTSGLRVLDVGCKNFVSSLALHAAARRWGGGEPHLTGVEVDAFRVYQGWHSRRDAAQYFLSLLPTPRRHRFLAGDVRTHDESHDLVTWFRPFLGEAALLRWGLPRRLLAPRELLEHVSARVAPGGTLVIVTQTPEEAELQRGLLSGCGLDHETIRLQGDLDALAGLRDAHVVRC